MARLYAWEPLLGIDNDTHPSVAEALAMYTSRPMWQGYCLANHLRGTVVPQQPISCKLFSRFKEEVHVLSHDVICRRMCNFQ